MAVETCCSGCWHYQDQKVCCREVAISGGSTLLPSILCILVVPKKSNSMAGSFPTLRSYEWKEEIYAKRVPQLLVRRIVLKLFTMSVPCKTICCY